MNDKLEPYWSDYDGLQYVKHQILSNYLNAWFPILTRFHGRVSYIDTHAGRGRHLTGHEGSPLIAINSLLNHKFRNQILSSSDVHFLFLEKKEERSKTLEKEIKKLGELPSQIIIEGPICEDYEVALNSFLDEIDRTGIESAPSFAFLDPFSFNLSIDLINRILSYPRFEVFLNLMCRQLDLAIHNPVHESNLNKLFGSDIWRKCSKIENYQAKITCIEKTFSEQLKADFIQKPIQMWEKNLLKYFLFHATNNILGWEKMKKAIWSVIPDGSFKAFEGDRPDQIVLVKTEPDYSELEDFILTRLEDKPCRYLELENDRVQLRMKYLDKHLKSHLKSLAESGRIVFSDWKGRKPLSESSNPLISLSEPGLFNGNIFN